MTNPNIQPEPQIINLADALRASVAAAHAPVRISPEVRETIMRALRMVLSQDTSRARWVECRQEYTELVGRIDAGKDAIAFIEALP